jgi:hypothetical protein
MMLQLVQSPSQRIQRLIESKCSQSDKTKPGAAADDKDGRASQQRQQAPKSRDEDDYNEADGGHSDGFRRDTRGGPPFREMASSSEASASSVSADDQEAPFVARVDRQTDRDGNLIATSAATFTSTDTDAHYSGDVQDEDDQSRR